MLERLMTIALHRAAPLVPDACADYTTAPPGRIATGIRDRILYQDLIRADRGWRPTFGGVADTWLPDPPASCTTANVFGHSGQWREQAIEHGAFEVTSDRPPGHVDVFLDFGSSVHVRLHQLGLQHGTHVDVFPPDARIEAHLQAVLHATYPCWTWILFKHPKKERYHRERPTKRGLRE
jgi:hypothetical protein